MANVKVNNTIYENISAVSLQTADGGRATYGGQSDWNILDESHAGFIKNKPFGELINTVTLTYAEDDTPIDSWYKVGEAPNSIYDLCDGQIKFYENETLIENTIYNDILSLGESIDQESQIAIYDFSPFAKNAYGIDNLLLVIMKDSIVDGIFMASGIYFMKKSVSTTSTDESGNSVTTTTYNYTTELIYNIYNKIHPKYLEKNLPTAWDDLAVKPFGEILDTITLTYDSAGTTPTIINNSLIKVGDCPSNLYELGLARLPGLDSEKNLDLNQQLILYPEILDQNFPYSETFELDIIHYGAILVDYGLLSTGTSANTLYVPVTFPPSIDSIIPIYISPNGGTFSGITFTPGIFFPCNEDGTDAEEGLYLEYDLYSKIPRKFLADNIGTSSGDDDPPVTDVLQPNLHIYNIGAGIFDITTFDMSSYPVGDIIFVVGDISTGEESS